MKPFTIGCLHGVSCSLFGGLGRILPKWSHCVKRPEIKNDRTCQGKSKLSPEAVGVVHLRKNLEHIVCVQHVFHGSIHLFHQGFQAEAICQLPHFQIEFHRSNLKRICQDEMEDGFHDLVGHVRIPSKIHFSISRLLPFVWCQHFLKIFAARHQKALVEEERRAFSQTEAEHLCFGGEIQPREEGLWGLCWWLDIRKIPNLRFDSQFTIRSDEVLKPSPRQYVVPSDWVLCLVERRRRRHTSGIVVPLNPNPESYIRAAPAILQMLWWQDVDEPSNMPRIRHFGTHARRVDPQDDLEGARRTNHWRRHSYTSALVVIAKPSAKETL